MATDDTARWRRVFYLLAFVVVLVPALVPFAELVGSLPVALDGAALVRLAGLGAALAVLALLVRQKFRSRGREVEGAPETRADRETEGTGEVYAPYAYNSQRRAQREGERIRERAEEIAEAERDARDRR